MESILVNIALFPSRGRVWMTPPGAVQVASSKGCLTEYSEKSPERIALLAASAASGTHEFFE